MKIIKIIIIFLSLLTCINLYSKQEISKITLHSDNGNDVIRIYHYDDNTTKVEILEKLKKNNIYKIISLDEIIKNYHLEENFFEEILEKTKKKNFENKINYKNNKNDKNIILYYNKECYNYSPIYEKNQNNELFYNFKIKFYDIDYKNKNFLINIDSQNDNLKKFIQEILKNYNNKINKKYFNNDEEMWKNIYNMAKYNCEFNYIPDKKKFFLYGKRDNVFKIYRKKFINNLHWNVSEINISENNKINLKKVKGIKEINYIIFENKILENFKNINLSENAILSIADDNIDYEEGIISKQNIIKNKISDEKNPKIINFNGKELKNPIIYEIIYGGFMFRLVGDETLYENKEIKDFIIYLKSFEKYF